MLMVVVIFAGLPLVSLRGEHVVFDSLDPLLPRRCAACSRRWWTCCARPRWRLAWLMWLKAGQMCEYGDTTAQLKIPLRPVRLCDERAVRGDGRCVHVLAARARRRARTPRRRHRTRRLE